MMRPLLRFVASLAMLFVVLGCVYVVFGGIGVYMVVTGRSVPGEPMYLDELTPPLADSAVTAGIGLLLIVVALVVRAHVRRILARLNRKLPTETTE